MKICVVQFGAKKGEVKRNIENHLDQIRSAIRLGADLVVFPEMSITGYEPALANQLATNKDDSLFNSFQELSDKNKIAIGVGMPIKTDEGINISMVIFQSNTERLVYSKGKLHEDEIPYFVEGNSQPTITIKGETVVLGICYETLHREHFVKAKDDNADVYIASVAKPSRGTDKAYLHFPSLAKEFKTPILMANSVGYCDNFLSNGLSSVWNRKGELIGQLDESHQGTLVYDTETEKVESEQISIEKGSIVDLESLHQIYRNAKLVLDTKGIFQWTDNYPNRSIIKRDLERGELYVLKNRAEFIGAVVLNEDQEDEYQTVAWEFDDSKVLVVHRLVVNPTQQGQGYARKLMGFAEKFATDNGYTSIRLDAYSQNAKALRFYNKQRYHLRGVVHFPGRKDDFHCLEKEITH